MNQEKKIVAVLGFGQANVFDNVNRVRIHRGFHHLRELEEEGIPATALIFGAGIGMRKSTHTLAERMALYARECIEKTNVRIRVIYNRDDHKVWGTIDEMQWIATQAQEQFGHSRVTYVTNVRHGERVVDIAYALGHPQPRIVTSEDPPPPDYHEMFAYLSIVAYKWGLHRPAQFLRRNVYGGG